MLALSGCYAVRNLRVDSTVAGRGVSRSRGDLCCEEVCLVTRSIGPAPGPVKWRLMLIADCRLQIADSRIAECQSPIQSAIANPIGNRQSNRQSAIQIGNPQSAVLNLQSAVCNRQC